MYLQNAQAAIRTACGQVLVKLPVKRD